VKSKNESLSRDEIVIFLKLLAPFAPYMTEELWQGFQNLEYGSLNKAKNDISKFNSIHLEEWPTYDEKYLITDTVLVVIQINGKKRGEVEVKNANITDQGEVEKMAKEVVKKQLSGLSIKKTIYVPGKIVNFVV
jgi:leucyl-tRNA synthetase